jgi:hypothetical protein
MTQSGQLDARTDDPLGSHSATYTGSADFAVSCAPEAGNANVRRYGKW